MSETTDNLQQLPLGDWHRGLGARMVPFAGYEMPVQYEGVMAEHIWTRTEAGLFDVSPLFKYEVTGPDAGAFLSRLTVKDVTGLAVGRVTYLCWCDDNGKVIDDGTVARLGEDHYRLTAAEPSISWLMGLARDYRMTIEDSTDRIGALALQGPESRAILDRVTI